MRFTTLLVAFALSVGVPTSAAAAPPKQGDVQSKGAPKKLKKTQGKKKQAERPTPKAPETPQVMRPLTAIVEPGVLRGEAESGLSVVASRRDDFASAAIVLSIPFGSRDEARGQEGSALATLRALEHVLGQELRALRAAGGDATFSVGPDTSIVALRAPAGSIDLALDVAAAGFTREITDADVDAAIASVGASSPSDVADAKLLGLVYQGYFPYEHAAEGSASTRDALDAKVVTALRAARWVPAHASLGITAPMEESALIDLVKTRFAGPKATTPRIAPAGELQEQTNQRTADVEITGASTTLRYAWAIPRAAPSERAALEVAAELLSTRGAIQDSVAKLSLAATVRARLERRAGVDLFVVEVDLPDNAPMKKARHAIEDVFLATSTKAASSLELAHAREARWVDELATLDDPVAWATRLVGSSGRLDDERELLDAVTPEAVRAAAAKFLGPLTRTIVDLHDPARTETPEKPGKALDRPSTQEPKGKTPAPTAKPAKPGKGLPPTAKPEKRT